MGLAESCGRRVDEIFDVVPVYADCNDTICKENVRRDAKELTLCETSRDDPLLRPGGYSFSRLLGEEWSDALQPPKRLCTSGDLVLVTNRLVDTNISLASIYEIGPRSIGWGAFGDVSRALHKKTGVCRAVKKVNKAQQQHDLVRREADILQSLDHPNIIKLYAVLEDFANLQLVLEFCEGGDLVKFLKRSKVGEREAATLFWQILSAVRHMHAADIVHRDLKLENILLARRGDIRSVKLADFGLAHRMKLRADMARDARVGTAAYMAPEVQSGAMNVMLVDRVDMWAMGVMLYVTLLRHFPSEEGPQAPPCPAHRMEELSSGAQDLIDKLMHDTPECRPNAALTMKHPWFGKVAVAEGRDLDRSAQELCVRGFRTFVSASCARKLALMAMARETDDRDVGFAWNLFEALDFHCEGPMTKCELKRVATDTRYPVLAAVARELSDVFCLIDVDGSHVITWIELVAALLSGETQFTASRLEEDVQLVDLDVEPLVDDKLAPMRLVLREDVCRRAFDLLSLGSGEICGSTIGLLLSRKGKRQSRLQDAERERDATPRNGVEVDSSECEEWLREVTYDGTLSYAAFSCMLRGAPVRGAPLARRV